MRAILILFFIGIIPSFCAAQMVLSGTATGACDCYELTDDTNEAGSVWSPSTIDLSNPFDFTFEVNLGADDVWGADGMMFVLRQSGTTTGGIGNGMGYSGIPNSIGIEIDTWNSSPTVATDIVDDHIGMSTGGTVEHDAVAPVSIANIEDGVYHTFRITWDPITFDLEVLLDGASIFIYNGDIVTLFFGGTPDVYFGWSGGTGGVDNIQSVCMYRDAGFTSDYTTACVGQTITFTDTSTSDLIHNLEEAITWDWDFGDGTTGSIQNPSHTYTATGTYSVTLTITDISGCSSTETVDITITDPLDLTMAHTDVTCFGLDDGTGTATPVTGTGPYSYSWDDPLGQTTLTSTDLAPNTYNVTVTDALGCVGTGTVTITEPIELILDAALTSNASCGLANGTITLVASGGTPALEYSIDGGTTFFPTGNFTGLLNGSYDVVIRDANNCEVTTVVNVGLDSPLTIDDVTATDANCGPIDDGTITITASSGVLPYEYSVDGGLTYSTSNFFDALPPGDYTVSVIDATGCEVFMDVTVGSLSTVVVDDVITTDVLCNGGADGEIEIIASGGTAPYTYSIDGGLTVYPTGDFTGITEGTYAILVTDDNDCEGTETATITAPSAIILDGILTTDVSCNGLSDGEFSLTVSGGTPGYTYSIDGGLTFQISPTFTGLVAADYSLEIEDANGCTITETTTVNQPDVLAIDDVILTDVTCDGAMDGGVDITAIGGTTPYQYRVNGGAYQLSPSFSGLAGGMVLIEVLDVNGCEVSEDVFLNEADPLVLAMGEDTTICLGGTAVLCPTVGGGTLPYTYMWDGMADLECLSTATIGEHSLQIIDVNGCTSEIENQIVNLYTPITATSSDPETICPGDDVILVGEATGDGPSPLSYEWTNDLDATVLDGPIHTVNPEETTTYTLTVTTGCENSESISVIVTTYPVPVISIDADIREGCQELDVAFESTTDPALVASTSWDFGDGNSSTGTSVNNTFVDADCYDVRVGITTVDGCIDTSNFTDYICVWQLPVADFSYQPEQPDLFSLTVEFENESEFASTYEWSFGDGITSSESDPDHTFPELGNRTYEVTLIATTDKGCTDQTTQFVTIDEIVLYYIPNAFTPNADPFNQTFDPVFIPGFFPTDYHFRIFNRWGELVFESYDPSIGWDGTYGGVIAEDGAYTWQLIFRENSSDKKFQEFGHILLLR